MLDSSLNVDCDIHLNWHLKPYSVLYVGGIKILAVNHAPINVKP